MYKLWASINRLDLSYYRFPVMTLIEALRHFPISKIHTKSINFERFHPVQHNFHINLDKNIFRINVQRMCVQIMGKYQQARFELWACPHRDIDKGSRTLINEQNAH